MLIPGDPLLVVIGRTEDVAKQFALIPFSFVAFGFG